MEKEREGKGEGEMIRGRREWEMRKGRRGIIVGGMVIGLLLGCNNGAIEELEKKNSFYESVVKIGQGFQEIFGIFGQAMGEALGFGAVKSDSKKSEVGEHFVKIKKGLEGTKNKLNELSGKISEAKNADTKGVEAVISSAGEVLTKLIESVSKLASVTKESVLLGDNHDNATAAAEKTGVEAMIEGIKSIIEEAEKSGVKINAGNPGNVTKDTTKKEVGEHFTTLGTKLGEASEELKQ